MLGADPTAAPRYGPLYLETLPASRGESAIASINNALYYSPTSAIGRLIEDNRIQSRHLYRSGEGLETPTLSPTEVEEQFGHLGISFDEPQPADYVAAVAERARYRAQQDAYLSRSQQPIIDTTIGIAAGILDPVSMASSFIPVVRPAQFAAMAGRMGVTGARAARGVIEGTVGTLLTEPIVAFQALSEQADYTAYDALAAVAFGVAGGAGLHVMAGAGVDVYRSLRGLPSVSRQLATMRLEQRLSDSLERMPLQQRIEVLSTAVHQLVTRGRVAVAEAFEGSPRTQSFTLGEQRNGVFRDYSALSTQELNVIDEAAEQLARGAGLVGQAPTQQRAISIGRRPDASPLEAISADQIEQTEVARSAQRRALRESLDVAETPTPAGLQRSSPDVATPSQIRRGIDRFGSEPVTRGRIERVADQLVNRQAIRARDQEIARQLVNRATALATGPTQGVPKRIAIQPGARDRVARSVGRPDPDLRVSEAMLTETLDEGLDVDAETEELGDAIGALRRAGELDADDAQALDDLRLADERAKNTADLYQAAAVCMIGR